MCCTVRKAGADHKSVGCEGSDLFAVFGKGLSSEADYGNIADLDVTDRNRSVLGRKGVTSDLLCFSIPNQGLQCGHVAVYAGTNNGEHFVAHVGSDEGPVFQTLERFENVVNQHDGCAYSVVYRFKDLPSSRYDYTVKTEKSSYKLKKGGAEPKLIVKDATGKTIPQKNYTVYYKNNKKLGTGKAIVVFKGKYKGTKTVKFKIKK